MADINDTLKERGEKYGSFKSHAAIAQHLQFVIRGESSAGITKWDTMANDSRQALTVIADKIARILNGDPEYDDNWRDIAGYATLVLNRILADKAERELQPKTWTDPSKPRSEQPTIEEYLDKNFNDLGTGF